MIVAGASLDFGFSVGCLSTINLSLSIREESSLPRPGGSAFVSFPKALVGEHRALSFKFLHILTLPCSPDVFHSHSDLFYHTNISNMRSYMSLMVLALAASTVSSAPIR